MEIDRLFSLQHLIILALWLSHLLRYCLAVYKNVHIGRAVEHDFCTTCNERPPVLRDRFRWAEGVVAQDRFYRIIIFMSKHIMFRYFFCVYKLSKHDMFAHKNLNISTGSSKLYSCID